VVPSVVPILNGDFQGDILGQDEQGKPQWRRSMHCRCAAR